MRTRDSVRIVGWIALIAFLFAASSGVVIAAEKAAAKKSEGRLPMYFAQVGLDDEQKASIVALQADYTTKLQTLEMQLESLRKERDAKVLAILKPDQKQKLDDMKSAAKTSRESKRPAKKSTVAKAEAK